MKVQGAATGGRAVGSGAQEEAACPVEPEPELQLLTWDVRLLPHPTLPGGLKTPSTQHDASVLPQGFHGGTQWEATRGNVQLQTPKGQQTNPLVPW
jgi:hypothetical protein